MDLPNLALLTGWKVAKEKLCIGWPNFCVDWRLQKRSYVLKYSFWNLSQFYTNGKCFYEKTVGKTPSRRASFFISFTYLRFFMEIMVCGNLFQVSKIWQKSHIFFILLLWKSSFRKARKKFRSIGWLLVRFWRCVHIWQTLP